MPFLSLELRNNTKAGADQAKSDLEKVSRAYDQVSQATERTSRGLQSANSSIKDATANVKQLAAQVVGLVAAYKALNAAKGFVQRGIEFSSSLEDAQTSIGSIIAATNKISTAQGKTLEGADEFNASLEISRDMMDEIQVLALESTATFDQLVQGVSGIIAPATKAGVALEKMPKFTVTAAQAMSTMKVPLEQMRTEIEALLSGNINKAQDILATNLGITGEMVRNWKEQGILVDELMNKLEPFALAGERVANSWSGLKSNMKDALDYLGKVTGEGLFESLKQSYRELLDLIISTDTGKPGISAEFENVASLMRDIQDAIGDGILDLTRDLIEELKELNKPENIAEIKRSFSEFKDVTVELFGAVKEVAGAVSSFVATSIQGWSSMPDIIQEMGIVGAVAFGAKGRAALLGIGAAVEMLEPLFALANEGQGGADAYKAYWANKNNQGNAPAMAVSHGGGEIAPTTPATTYKTTPAISDSGKKASTSVDNARQKIAELRREIEQMQGSSTKTVSDLAKKFEDIAKAGKAAGLSAEQVRSLQQEYRDAFQAKTLEDFNKELLQAQGNTTALKNIQIAETLRGWTQQFQAAGMTAEQYAPKIAQLKTALEQQQGYKDLQTAADFYRELGDLSGSYGQSIEYQNQLIEQQAQLYRTSGIPEALVQQWQALKKLETARDPWSGFARTTNKYFSDATNWAERLGSIWGNTMDGMADALTEFCMTGKLNFNDLANSFIQQVIRMQMQAAVSGLFKGIGSLVMGGLGDMFTTTTSSVTSEGVSYENTRPGGWHRGGLVGVDSPTFTRSVPLMAFEGAPRLHSGGGWFRSDEYPAILQRGERVLNRDETAAYHAGMAAGGDRGNSSGREPAVYVTINNTTGEPVSTQRSRDGNGNTNIEVLVGNVVAKRLASPGTELNRAVRATTGARQSVIGR